MISFVNFRSTTTLSSPGWVNMATAESTQESLKDFTTDQPNGWVIDWDVPPDGSAPNLSPSTAGVGDADWVIAGALLEGHRPLPDGIWSRVRVSGLNDEKRYRIACIGSVNATGRISRFRVSGAQVSAIQELDNYDHENSKANDSETVVFEDVQPLAGEIYIEFSRIGSIAYINAAYIEEVESTSPASTINQTDARPNTAITGTYSNFPSAPLNEMRLEDSFGNFREFPVIITDVFDETAGTHSGTWEAAVPNYEESGTILHGVVTYSLKTLE